MAKKQPKEMLEKMSDEQKDEVLKKNREETERKALYRMKKKLENSVITKKLQLHQKMHITLAPAKEKPLQGSKKEISLVVLVKEELFLKS